MIQIDLNDNELEMLLLAIDMFEGESNLMPEETQKLNQITEKLEACMSKKEEMD